MSDGIVYMLHMAVSLDEGLIPLCAFQICDVLRLTTDVLFQTLGGVIGINGAGVKLINLNIPVCAIHMQYYLSWNPNTWPSLSRLPWAMDLYTHYWLPLTDFLPTLH